jgi:primosomal protein N' (replication factor Y)
VQDEHEPSGTIKTLNAEQQLAVNSIVASLQSYKPFLLEGVTGSGKTEVYMQAIEQCLAKNLQALVLVPEIGLTPQMLARFESRFSVPIAVLHSSISEKKRATAWKMAKEGTAAIVLGTRSSAFTPLKNPGLFIIDEEHDASFKQQDGFRYSARDLMVMRAYLEKCPIVLGSATPSLESLQNAKIGRYSRLLLPVRAGNAKLPKIQVLDIRHKKLDEGLSAQFIGAMKTHLEQNGQILLFLNRRGFAPTLMCFDCGFVANCKRCDAKLTLHSQSKKLRCHHCEYSCTVYERCPSCQNRNLSPLGVGTERVEAVLQRYFPDKEIVRIDRDSTSRKGKMEEALNKIHKQEAQILLGTQMLAKGHHFPNVTLVGILDIDQALFSNDFRSTERLGQLVTQVAGRAGRSDRLGQVMLQSCHPEHPLLQTLIEKGYTPFADHLLLERRATALPPFSYQVLIRSETKINTQSFNFLKQLKDIAQQSIHKNNLSLQILGPVTAPMEKKDGKYRCQLLLQANKRNALQSLMADLICYLEENSPPRSVRWSLDVDPIDMF